MENADKIVIFSKTFNLKLTLLYIPSLRNSMEYCIAQSRMRAFGLMHIIVISVVPKEEW